MDDMKEYMICQSISDLCNLLINSEPADGPMIKGVLTVSLMGIESSGVDVRSYDGEKLDYLKNIYKELCAGRYNILPAHLTDVRRNKDGEK
ncbi:MAG: hypothetical protein NC131_13545 [Roseburia sp.]|nr:hypothetical protein [Roseburia sp.]